MRFPKQKRQLLDAPCKTLNINKLQSNPSEFGGVRLQVFEYQSVTRVAPSRKLRLQSELVRLCDCDEVVCFESGAADESAVDVLLSEELLSV